jgi:sulfate-transporting ATPase
VPAAAAAPDLLLLDEPTNHLDAESVAWLERFLAEYKGTVVAVTHDRYFLDNVAGWILELDRGRGIPWEGQLLVWLEQKQERLAQSRRSRSRAAATLERELEWVRMSPRRGRRRQGALGAYEKLLAEERRREARRGRDPHPARAAARRRRRRGEGRAKGYGDRLLIEDLTSRCRPAASSASSARTAPARRRCSG